MKLKQSGFTLVEVIIALSIVVGAVVVVNGTWSGNLMRIRKSTLNNNVAFLLQKKVTEIEVKYKDKPLSEIKEQESGDFGETFKNYKWEMTSRDFEMPDLSAAIIGQQNGADETLLSMIKQTSEYISKAIKEVTVTVIVTVRQKELRYSVTTYLVDYSQELSLSGLGAGGGN